MTAISQKPAISPRTRAKVRQQALRHMCCGPEGKLHRNAQLILHDLREFCRADGLNSFPVSPVTGQIDPLALARAAGRREVFDRLVRMLAVSLEDRHNLEGL